MRVTATIVPFANGGLPMGGLLQERPMKFVSIKHL
jgi:hypothetical protein